MGKNTAEYVPMKNKKEKAKYVYYFFLAYLLVLVLISGFINQNLYALAGTIIVFILSVTFSKKCLLFIEKSVLKGKVRQGVKLKTVILKMLYLTIFLFIPLIFVGLISEGQWQVKSMYESSGFISPSENRGYIRQTLSGTVTIIPKIDNEMLIKFQYILGNTLNLPIFDICFNNNGTTMYGVINETFVSRVTLYNDTYPVQQLGSYCRTVRLETQNIDYVWSTEYSYTPINVVNENSEWYEVPKTSYVDVKTNGNFWIMSFLIIVFWIGLCHLIYGVIKNFNEII